MGIEDPSRFEWAKQDLAEFVTWPLTEAKFVAVDFAEAKRWQQAAQHVLGVAGEMQPSVINALEKNLHETKEELASAEVRINELAGNLDEALSRVDALEKENGKLKEEYNQLLNVVKDADGALGNAISTMEEVSFPRNGGHWVQQITGLETVKGLTAGFIGVFPKNIEAEQPPSPS